MTTGSGFGLYVHWPFCQAKCPYCDFNSHVVSNVDQSRWATAFVSEIERYAAFTSERILDSVFFGGGTPSLMAPETVATILESVRKNWRSANDLEVTLEANPTSVEASKFAGFRDAGVNRVSLGVQALNDTDLKALGRLHSVSEAMTAFDVARTAFNRVSFDLIYARQNQTLANWEKELQNALSYADGHLSLYQLTIEDGTAFGDRYKAGKLRDLPNDGVQADMYFATQDICSAAGYDAYEISNHATAGQESKHNLIYWRSADYIGIGPGAHGRLTLGGSRFATDTPLQPGAWLDQVEQTGNGERHRDLLSDDDILTERVMMGLRTREGVDLDLLSDGFHNNINKINTLTENQLLKIETGRVSLTRHGQPLLNAVLHQLLDV